MKRSLCLIVVLMAMLCSCTPAITAAFNGWIYGIHKADDATNYNTLKEVEDTCRAMIASYTADKLMYEQYINSDDEEKQSWAYSAMSRANRTATQYNEYILKNSYVWSNAVPNDIKTTLEYIGVEDERY